MTDTKQVTLQVAAFLDSPEARALHAPEPAEVRKIAEIFLAVCYDELGKTPRLLDGQDVQDALGRGMPAPTSMMGLPAALRILRTAPAPAAAPNLKKSRRFMGSPR